MKSRLIQKEPEIVISLTWQEAKWLKAVMQNPIGTTFKNENPEDSEIRSAFWEELTIQGV